MLSTSSVKETDVEKIHYYYLVVCDGMYINDINGPIPVCENKKTNQCASHACSVLPKAIKTSFKVTFKVYFVSFLKVERKRPET